MVKLMWLLLQLEIDYRGGGLDKSVDPDISHPFTGPIRLPSQLASEHCEWSTAHRQAESQIAHQGEILQSNFSFSIWF